jgi:2'-5' RNA ligase
MARLSIAVWPPADIVQVLKALPRPQHPQVRWSMPEQWLVKVRPLGFVDEEIIPKLVDALMDELDGAPPMVCVLGPATRRLGGQWLGAPVSGLDDLAAVVFEATEELVPVTHPQPFQADVILARGRVPKNLAGAPVSGSWTASSVNLVADRSSPRAVRFEDMSVIPLTG